MNIPDSVTSIGKSAFTYCEALSSIAIPASVTVIDDWVFRGCSSLASVDIPDSVTSIGSRAFYGCTSLASVDIPDSVTSIGNWAFRECTSLDSIALPASVTAISDSAFCDCTSLASVDIPGSVTAISDSAFFGCTSLALIFIPGSVTTIGDWAFFRLTFLGTDGKALNQTPEAISGHLFEGSGDGVLRMADPKPLDVGGRFTSGGLVYEVVSQSPASVSLAGYAGSPSAVSVPGSVTHFGFEYAVVSVGDRAFYGCSGLRSASLPDTVRAVGDYAFFRCASLESLDLGSAESVGLKSFSYCESLASISIPGTLKRVGGYAFFCCAGLKEVTVEDGAGKIGRSAFSGCKALEMVSLPKSLVYIGPNAFYGVTFLDLDGKAMDQTLKLRGHAYFGSGKVLRMAGDIEDGERFSAGGIDYSVSSAGSREVTAVGFSGAVASLPGEVSYKGWALKVTAVADKAFYGCSTLKSADLTNARSVGMKAFANCVSLEEVAFGGDLGSVGPYAFFGLAFYDGGSRLQPVPETLSGHAFSGSDAKLHLAS